MIDEIIGNAKLIAVACEQLPQIVFNFKGRKSGQRTKTEDVFRLLAKLSVVLDLTLLSLKYSFA